MRAVKFLKYIYCLKGLMSVLDHCGWFSLSNSSVHPGKFDWFNKFVVLDFSPGTERAKQLPPPQDGLSDNPIPRTDSEDDTTEERDDSQESSSKNVRPRVLGTRKGRRTKYRDYSSNDSDVEVLKESVRKKLAEVGYFSTLVLISEMCQIWHCALLCQLHNTAHIGNSP